jgi:type I restriction enzyme S subunit
MITEPPDAVFASYLIRVRASKDLEPGFLIQFFQSRAYWQQVDANKHANLKKGVNGSILSELLLPLPPLPEQKKIAHILSTVQRAIEAQERIIQTTTELKKALMHKLFTEGLRGEPQKQTEIGPIPKSWEVVPLKRVALKPQYGLTAKAAKSGTTKFLRITDITDEGVNWSTVPFCSGPKKKIDACRLKSGDIVFARIGATTGKSYMITDPPDAVFASYLIRVRASESLEPAFLIQFFQSKGYWQQVDANKHANLKKGVNGSILSEMFVPLPTLEAQKEIAAAFMATDQKVRTAAAKRDALKDLFRTLLHELMTAKTRVHEQETTT